MKINTLLLFGFFGTILLLAGCSGNIDSVKIGSQKWSEYNLDIDHFRNGDKIPEAKTFEEWKKAFIDLQGRVDMLVLENNAGIQGWNEVEAKKFVRAQTSIPTGCIHDFMAEYSLVGYTKIGEEQGEWSAGAALQILSGKSPKDIPVVTNQKGQLYANLAVAKALNVTFPLATLKAAKVIKE